jgi:hypothetical protein
MDDGTIVGALIAIFLTLGLMAYLLFFKQRRRSPT